jgi:hypothetical protein
VPLDDYGVLVGTLTGWFRDTPDNQGRWYHVNLTVGAPAAGSTRSFRCAVDVDSKMSAIGVQWKLLRFTKESLGPPAALAPGYHALDSTSSSGALDLIRHPSIRDAPGCLVVRNPGQLLGRFSRSWVSGSNQDASVALESILVMDATVYVFGEPFTSGFGMHNIHQNQGDPAGSQWWDENGTWQDGGVLVLRPDGSLDAFVSKFSSQSPRTDENGHPRSL